MDLIQKILALVTAVKDRRPRFAADLLGDILKLIAPLLPEMLSMTADRDTSAMISSYENVSLEDLADQLHDAVKEEDLMSHGDAGRGRFLEKILPILVSIFLKLVPLVL